MNTPCRIATLAALASLLAPAAARAQPARAAQPPSVASPAEERRAAEILDAAVRAHGGADALRRLRTVHVAMEGHDVHRHQSRRVPPPYDSTVRRHELRLDLARGRLVHQQTRGYPGGFSYTTRFVTDSARHYLVDVRNGTWSEEEWPPAAEQTGNVNLVPQLRLLALHEDTGATPRHAGTMRLPSGATVDAVETTLPNGAVVTLGFDRETGLLRAESSRGTDPMAGDEVVVTEHLDWRTVDGVPVPGRRVTTRGATVVADLRYTAFVPGAAIPDSLLAPPPGFAAAPPPPAAEPVRELAPGVWSVRSGFANVLAVRLDDGLLVVDAPPRGVADVVARLAEVAPGVPIRLVVPTHHHDDHFTGVRDHVAAGATVVTTPGNVAWLRQALLARTPAPVAAAPHVELVPAGGHRTFGSGARTVEIHDVGPSPHADEMLVAWLPAEGILFQGDLIEAPTGVARRGSNAETTVQLADFVRRKGWDVRTIVGAHGPPMPRAELDALARLPILPPR